MIVAIAYTNTDFDCIFSDETFPFGTPYDECTAPLYDDDDDMDDEIVAQSTPLLAKPTKPSIRFDDVSMNLLMGRRSSPVHIYQKIDGCYIRCDILDEKIFDATVQLKDVQRHRSRYEADVLRARANAAMPLVRKKFRSAHAIASSKNAIAGNASVSDSVNVHNTISKSPSTSGLGNRTKFTGVSTNEVRARANQNSDSPTVDNSWMNDSNEIPIGSTERRVRPLHMRSPMPKFIVTKVTEKEKSRETVKFDIRNELKIVRNNNLNASSSYNSLKSARKMMRKEISDAHQKVQLQRRKSLQIFNAHDESDGTDSDTDGFLTNDAGLNSDGGTDSEPARWNFSRSDTSGTNANNQPGPRTIYTVKRVTPATARPKTNEQKTELKTKLVHHRSTILRSCNPISPHEKLAIERWQPKRVTKKNLPTVSMAETTDVDSEYERNTVEQRRKSQRQGRRSKKSIVAAESEPEFTSESPTRQTASRRSYVTDVTDFETDTDGEAFFGATPAKRRRQPNKKYEDDSTNVAKKSPKKQKSPAEPSKPKKPRREYKPRKRKSPEEKPPDKAATPRKPRGRPKKTPVVEITESRESEEVPEQERIVPTAKPLPSIYNFTPLGELPDLASVVHKKACVGKSKSDVSVKIRTQDMLYSTAAKMLRRYSFFAGSRAPIDLIRRVMSQRDAIYSSARKSVTPKGKRRGRKKRASTARKKRPNFTKQLLDSPDFSSLIDIARLNEINVDHPVRDDDDDSGSDVGDIEQQLSVIRRGQHLGSLETMSSPLAHIKLLKAGRTVQTRKSNTDQRKPFEKLITRLPLAHLKGMDLLLPMVAAANEIKKDITCTTAPIAPAKKSLEVTSNGHKPMSTSPTVDGDTKIVPRSNTESKKARELFVSETTAKDAVELITEPSEMVVEQVYDEDDIESPAFEPHVSNSCSESFQETVEDFGAQQLSKTRVRTKRTRGRIRWSKPRKRPPIKFQNFEDTSTTDINMTISTTPPPPPPERKVNDRDKNVNKLPPKILNSLPIQRLIAPTTRGRKRRNENAIAPIVTVKSITQKRGRFTRQETSKTLSLSIEPVNFNEM